MKRLNAEMLSSLLQADLEAAGHSPQEYYPGQSVLGVACYAISQSLTKKYHDEETDSARDAAALQLFLDCNQRCADFQRIEPRDTFEELVVGELKRFLYEFVNPAPGFRAKAKVDDFTLFVEREPLLLNLTDIADRFGLGPGANVGAKGTSLYVKLFASSLTFTDPSLPILYRHGISGTGEFQAAETQRHAEYKTRCVSGNQLSFVPKSTKISRTICTEPSLNMLFQKGIGLLLEERLKEVLNIDLSRQPSINAGMARRGSIGDGFATIDLTSASDTISMNLVNELFADSPEFLKWLRISRSPRTVLPDGRVIDLQMISSMGNAFTFPLQTLIFSALVAAVYKCLDIPVQIYGEGRNFSVFGDDIVVLDRVYTRVVSCLELLGFQPNRKKSFNTGFFRESCGSDYFQGHNVRGVYITRLRSRGDFYSAINRLNRWSAHHRVPLPRLVGYLRKCGTKGNPWVPFDESDDAGIKVPYMLASPKHTANGSARYTALIPVPRAVRIPEASQYDKDPSPWLQRLRRSLGDFSYNESGLLVAFLAGWLRTGKLTTRPKGRLETKLKGRVCPCWDGAIPRSVETRSFRDEWKFFTELNLTLD